MIEIRSTQIDTNAVIRSVMTPRAGAIDIFIGTTRDRSNGKNVERLYYEAYEPMALGKMEDIRRDVMRRWKVHAVSMVHRTGEVPVGEASVVIAVSSSHRREAFESCRYCIDRLKEIVPIWKRERFADGTEEWSGDSADIGRVQ
jgi:molybdopterin synthase catalytic subunit